MQAVDAQFECALALMGSVQTDALLGRHFVAYSAEGADCDAAAEALSSESASSGAQFMRRPSLAQLRVLVADMVRSVEMASGCRILLRGTPTLNEATARWFVSYTVTGANCAGVQSALGDLGRDLDISFIGGPARGRADGIPQP